MKKNRNCNNGWLMVLLIAILAVPALGQAGVGLFNARHKQVVTSSSLKWTNLKKVAMDNYVTGADSEQGLVYLCRARHEGDMLLGQLRPDYSSCTVSGSKSFNNFEVLENIENASLIIWKDWSKFHSKPSGAVLADSLDSIYIGRKGVESGSTYYIGRISYENSIGHLITYDEKGNELVLDNGEILIEVEPVSYKLNNLVLDLTTEHIRQTDPVVFEERILRNDDEVGATVTTEIEYKFNYTVSWGHGHGIAIGLNTTIELADGTVLPQIKWANPFSEQRKELFKLEKYLESGTACNVTFGGNYSDSDVQYTAKLETFYKDNNARTRQIRGERIENTVRVEAIYGEIYFIGNNSLVPTTTTATTTTTTTTTTQPPETLPPAPEENDVASPMKKPNESVEIDSSDMLSDSSEGGKTPSAKEDTIKSASVGELGSKPNEASIRIVSLIFIILPVIVLL